MEILASIPATTCRSFSRWTIDERAGGKLRRMHCLSFSLLAIAACPIPRLAPSLSPPLFRSELHHRKHGNCVLIYFSPQISGSWDHPTYLVRAIHVLAAPLSKVRTACPNVFSRSPPAPLCWLLCRPLLNPCAGLDWTAGNGAAVLKTPSGRR